MVGIARKTLKKHKKSRRRSRGAWNAEGEGLFLIAHVEQLVALFVGEFLQDGGDAGVVLRPLEGGGAVGGVQAGGAGLLFLP